MNDKFKKILTTILTLFLVVTTFTVASNNSEKVSAEGGYELIKTKAIENVFDISPYTTGYVQYMKVVAPDGTIQEVFCADPTTPARAGYTYSAHDMETAFDFAHAVLYAWQNGHIGELGSATAGEYMAVQLAIWGRYHNYDPSQLRILSGLDAETVAMAERIRTLASALYNESFSSPSSSQEVGTTMKYFDANTNQWKNFSKNGLVIDYSSATKAYSFPNSSNPNQKYFRSPLLAVTPTNAQLSANFRYTVELEGAPAGTIVTDSNFNQTNNFAAKSSQGTAFYVFVPVEAGESTPAFKIKTNESLSRFTARLWFSDVPGSQTLISRYMVNENHNHYQYALLGVLPETLIEYEDIPADPTPIPELDPEPVLVYTTNVLVKKTGEAPVSVASVNTEFGTMKKFNYENVALSGVPFSIQYTNDVEIGGTTIPGSSTSAVYYASSNMETDANGEIIFKVPVAVPATVPADDQQQTPTSTKFLVKEVEAPVGYIKGGDEDVTVNTMYCNRAMQNLGDTSGNPFVYCRKTSTGGDSANLGKIVVGLRLDKATQEMANKRVTNIVDVSNTLQTLSFRTKKVNENKQALEGAVYGLYTNEAYSFNGVNLERGSLVALLTSDDSGNLELTEKLPASISSYTLKELKAPQGYTKDNSVYQVYVENNKGYLTNAEGEALEELVDTPVQELEPVISTMASVNSAKTFTKGETLEFKDVVSYRDLTVGQEYTLKTVLMDKVANVAVEGTNKTSSFTPTKSNDSYTVTFNLDTSNLEFDHEYVFFEELYLGETKVTDHQDINDKDQTVKSLKEEKVISLKTTATVNGEKTFVVGPETKLDDKVEIENLTIGDSYILETEVYNKKTGEAIPGTKFTTNLNNVTASKMTANLSVTLDTSNYEDGDQFVFFETLKDANGVKVAEHREINDPGQTVTAIKNPEPVKPSIRTNATVNGAKEFEIGETLTFKDEVSFSNLDIEKTYTLKTVLMDKAANSKVTGSEKETPLKPESKDGKIEVSISLDTSKLKADSEYVFFEELYLGEELVADHKDLTDKNQTVKSKKVEELTPSLKTSASVDNEKTFIAKGNKVIVDVITYKDVPLGKYIMETILWDKTNNDFYKESGELVKVETPFEIKETSGELTVNIPVNANNLKPNQELVVFEYLKQAEEIIVKHEDPNDAAQTVKSLKLVDLEIQKVSGNKLLEGAEFTLYKSSDINHTNPIKSGSTGQDGTIRFVDLEPDSYDIVETKAPTGYVKLEQAVVVDLSLKEAGSLTEVKVENQVAEYLIRITKLDAYTNKTLSGAVYGLYDGETLLTQGTSDSQGIIEFSNVSPNKKYIIKEISAPNGYVLDEKGYEVELSGNNKIANVTVTDKPISSTIVVKKVDADGKNVLAGAQFALYRKSDVNKEKRLGNIVTTNENGLVSFTGAAKGEYVLVEVKAPEGYVKYEGDINVVVGDATVNGFEVTVTVKNSKVGEKTPDDPVKVEETTPKSDPTPQQTPTKVVNTGVLGESLIPQIIGVMLSVAAIVALLILKKRQQ